MQTVVEVPEGWTIECPECCRMVLIYRRPGRELVVLVQGDVTVEHSWSSQPGVSARVVP